MPPCADRRLTCVWDIHLIPDDRRDRLRDEEGYGIQECGFFLTDPRLLPLVAHTLRFLPLSQIASVRILLYSRGKWIPPGFVEAL